MATVQEDILKAFYAKLAKSKEFDEAMIDSVRTLLGSVKKMANHAFWIVARKDGCLFNAVPQ